MIDKMTNKPRGFGFVTFQDDQGLHQAIGEMHNTLLEEKKISVTEAVPQDKMPRYAMLPYLREQWQYILNPDS